MSKKKKAAAGSGTSTRVCFVIDREDYKDLRIAAVSQDMTVSDVLRDASEAFVRRHQAK